MFKKLIKPLIKPPALHRGDTVALIAPASRLPDGAFERTQNAFRQFGFAVVHRGSDKKFGRRDSFFSDSDERRADELNWALSQPGIKAIFCMRGGYGSVRTLAALTARAATKRWTPKLILGYSDITYLHQWIQNQVGWLSFHAPLVGMLELPQLKKYLGEVLNLARTPHSEKWTEVKKLPGAKPTAEGRLVGGSLSLIQTSGPAALPKENMILAVEEVNEDFYRIDRSLWMLKDAGYDRWIKGILLGTMKGCGSRDSKTFRLERVLDTLKILTKGPIWTGCRFGHGLQSQRILPLGSRVRMKGQTLSFLESVVC